MAVDKKNLKNIRKTVSKYVLHITTTISNTFMTLCDEIGNVIFVVSCGKLGIKGSKKNTPFAVERLLDEVIKFLNETVAQELKIKIKGPFIAGNFISKLDGHKFKVTEIENSVNPAFNGVRLKREKRKWAYINQD